MNKISTRGLIGIKKGKKVRYAYSDSDSYPSSLMNTIYRRLLKCADDKDYKKLEDDISNGVLTSGGQTNVMDIDYLWDEYIYVLDFEKKKWRGFKTQEDKRRVMTDKLHRYGKLIPLIEDLDFKDHIHFYRNEDNFECVTKVESMEDKIDYKIIFDGKKYILIDKDDKLIGTGRNKKKLIVESVAESL